MTEFEVAWTDAVGKVVRRLFNSYDELCGFLERFHVRKCCWASVKETET